MRVWILIALVAALALGLLLGLLLGHEPPEPARIRAETEGVEETRGPSPPTLAPASLATDSQAEREALAREEEGPAPEVQPSGARRERVPDDLILALQRAIDAGQIAEYEAQRPGWLARQLFEVYLGVGAVAQAWALSDRVELGADAVERLAPALLEAGDLAGAAELYRGMLEANPWDSSAQHGLRRSDPAALVAVLEGGIADHPGDPTLELRLGWALHAAGRAGDALELSRRLLSEDPEDSRGWHLFAQIAPAEAEAWTRERLGSDPGWAPHLAGLLEDRGATEEAIEVLNSCLEGGFHEDAIAHLTDLDAPAAVSYLAGWSRQDPGNRELLVRLAEAQEYADQSADAAETWSRLLRADSETPDWKAVSELLRLDPDRFFLEVRPAIDASGDARRWSQLADWYKRAERMDEARAALDRAVELEPWRRRWREERAQLE